MLTFRAVRSIKRWLTPKIGNTNTINVQNVLTVNYFNFSELFVGGNSGTY